ncbi:uncharacterized protein IUM83_11981 [Phytophthora cinnamomi]|uniref:uncharacterized protein n=1 Tax=Phytophthora cinnamomi TaxID=4785 RepID=UPI00355A68D5|nr:hypothetical protein IUM83_11981 [Phytophthora cinnamomi]
MRVLQASRSAENALEMLAQCGIVRHLVGSVDPRRATSQPTAESPQTAPKADAVTYTSSRVWLTGFLHFGEDVDACDTLHLCDNNAKLPSFLLDPSPQLVDQLVLVKRWVLVDKAFGGVRTAGSMFLEALQLIKRRGCWKHAEPQPGVAFYRECKWRQQHWAISDPAFETRTYLGTTRRRFEDILSHYVDDLSYFSGRTATGSIATSRVEREREYYQNELRAFVVGAIPALRSVAVFARRFYKAQQRREGTSVLTFGKDIHLTTKTAPQPKLEARRVDRLHVRSELRRRLAQLRRSGPD